MLCDRKMTVKLKAYSGGSGAKPARTSGTRIGNNEGAGRETSDEDMRRISERAGVMLLRTHHLGWNRGDSMKDVR